MGGCDWRHDPDREEFEGLEDGIRRTWPLIRPVIEQSARIAIAQGDLVYRTVTESTD